MPFSVMKCLNLGCGNRYLESWDNVDFVSSGKGVKAHNLLAGIPFGDGQFDVVYHSHVLEHFPKDQAATFIKECFRVLKPGGVIRVVVPDLEGIIREYILNLDGAVAGDEEAKRRYEWIVIELMDQMVRNKSGGHMMKYWSQDTIENESYITSRSGFEFLDFRKKVLESPRSSNESKNSGSGLRKKLMVTASGEPNALEYFQIGRFRSHGETHQWMYDRYSLGKLLNEAGFNNPQKVTAFTSSISQWKDFQWLDVEKGNVRKPDSLFMEAVK